MSKKDIVLTGVPRSGTTLTCFLLNKLPNCIALHEPLSPLALIGKERHELIEATKNFFLNQRQQILSTGQALSKSVAGNVPDNSMAGFDIVTGKRIRILDGKSIKIEKPLTSDFVLAIKQPAFFTAILADLVKSNYFDCYAIIRNPLSVLLSWNSVEMPVSQGRAPGAEGFDVDLKSQLDNTEDIYDRQLLLLDWFFQQYLINLPKKNVIYYEYTVRTSGRSLSVIHPDATSLVEALSSRNNNTLYDSSIKTILFDKLLGRPNAAFWNFYSEADIIKEMQC